MFFFKKKKKKGGVGGQLANDFVAKSSQEASLKLCLFSLLCIQLKTQPSQAKKFQSKGCQCLFTVRESAGTFVHLFQKRWKRVSQFLPGIKTQPRAGQLSITPLFVAMLICTNTPRSSATRQPGKLPQFFWCREHPETLITQVWGKAERGARHPGEKCIVYLCILKRYSVCLLADIWYSTWHDWCFKSPHSPSPFVWS